MNKKLLLFSIALVLVVSLNLVSAIFHYPQYQTDNFRETTEFKRVTVQNTGNFWNYESTKKTVIEKTETRKRIRTPSYSYYNYPNYYGNSYYNYPNYRARSYFDNSYVPSSSWRFKESYDNRKYVNAHYNDYYYKPRYDSSLGYYNWRW